MTVRTRSQLNGDADANLPDNTSGAISPADIRGAVKDLADSAKLAEDLGGAADLDVGTTAGTVAAGDDSRIVGAVQSTALDTDGTLAANSDSKIATQKATKTYVDQIVAAQDAMVFKGVIDCSASPNYPAADRGWTYRVSVAGKIGGGSGPNVQVGDILMCLTDGTSSGNHATVGASWSIIQVNIDGALTTADIGSAVQAYSAVLTALVSAFSPASSSGPAYLDLPEDTDNGSNRIRLTAPASIASDVSVTLPGTADTLVGRATTDTLTNKRVTPRVTSITSSATPTVNTDDTDFVDITALAAAITSMTSSLSGTPTIGQKLIYQIKDNGTARAITWGASFAAKGAALPTTTVISKLLTVGFIWNGSTWGCVASAQEA